MDIVIEPLSRLILELNENSKILSNLGKEILNYDNELYNYLDKILFNLGIGYYYKKSLDKVNEETSRIHNILLKGEKYWIDKKSFQVYAEHIKN